jgi:outer membrane biosynthesis protein TonB
MTRSPRHLRQQVKDTVGEQVRDLPLHAVRLAMFGVGRALLLSDRLTKDYKEITEGGGVRPVIGRLRDDVQHTAEKVVGRVVERVRGEETAPEPEPEPRKTAKAGADGEIAVGKPATAPRARAVPDTKAEPKPEAKPAPEPEAKPEKPEPEAAFEPKPESKPAAPAEAEKLAADLPVPNYDEATLPQLRARLRGLSSEQVKLLREYERKHAARPDVLRMYENRIAKLNGLN